MASKEEEAAEENGGCNTETEEETIALRKKRSRRVSFAETTAIHLFIRDDEYETPPDAAAAAANNSNSDGDGRLARTESDEIMELLQSSSDDSDAEADGDVAAINKSFLRPMESPSPGSCFGSATSNDEDNFFGPVSMDFIKPRRLSDSAASDENHDITMDSTAFSMHFRSLAQSDSVGDSKTPTRTHLAFGERTPGQISTTNSVGDLMVLTTSRKPTSHSSLPYDRVHDSGHSDDMSLVSENPHRYDYGKLPPELDVLLAEGGKDVGAAPLNSHASPSTKNIVSSPDRKRHRLLDVAHNIDADISVVTGTEKTSAAAVSSGDMEFYKKTDATSNAPVTLVENPRNKSDSLDDDLVTVIPTDNQGMPFDKDEKTMGILTETSGNLGSPSSRTQLNINHEQLEGSFDAGSISSLLAKRRKIFKVPVSLTNESSWTPLARELSVKGSIKNVWSTSLFSKGVSRLKRLEAFPFASTSKAERTTTRLSNNVGAPVVRLEARFSDVAKNNGEFMSKGSDSSLNSVGNMKHEMSTEAVDDMRSSSSLTTGLSSLERFRKNIKKMDSPSSTGSQKIGLDHHMSKDNYATVTQQSTSDSSFQDITLNKHGRAAVMSDYSAFPSDNRLENQVSGSSQYLEDHSMGGHQQGQSHLTHWADVFTSLCGLTTQLLSPFIDKLDQPQMMEKLDDTLVYLEKVKSYECLSHNICSQKTFDTANYLQNKRLMDVRSLLYCTVYKKAKLQLLNLKRDKLLDQVQQLHSRVQDSETLKSSFLCSDLHGKKDVQADCTQPESSPIDNDDKRLGPIGLSSLRKELEESDRKINSLKESFYTYLKIAKEPTCANISEYAIDFLKKRVSCRSLLSKLQLWEIESLTAKSGEQNFLFNHHGFLSQRFIVNVSSTPTVSISKKLSDLKISKLFRIMDAYTGFSFIFGGDTTVRFTGLRTITQETQRTHSMLQCLLDVVEEVELALMELRNLTHSRFSLPSAGKLDLLLCFRDFRSGARVNLNIDITCLNRGVYPSHVVPYEVQGRAAGNDESFQILLSNIRTGITGLRCGYMRIINICRCVSKMMQS